MGVTCPIGSGMFRNLIMMMLKERGGCDGGDSGDDG